MPESYVPLDSNTLFCRHNTLVEHRPSVLLLHGLGDSGLAFAEIFEDRRFDAFNVVVPDLLGYGRSSHDPEGRYTFKTHLAALHQVIEHFGLERITLVGHSMGGDLGTLLCLREEATAETERPAAREPEILRFLNVEGNLTSKDLFISGEAAKADRDHRFDEWFTGDFTFRQVYGEWSRTWRFGRRYLASLQFCDPIAFLRNAQEMHSNCAKAGSRYREVSVPKLFVFGQQSLNGETREYIRESGLDVYEIVGGPHWPMIDYAEEFYDVLFKFCEGEVVGGRMASPAAPIDKAQRRMVANVKVAASAEYDDPSVIATLDESYIPWLIREARLAQDALLLQRFQGRALRVADIGCGNGYHAKIYADHCTLYHGYEISREMVEVARRRCAGLTNVKIIKGDAYRVALRSSRYDVAWCLYFGAGNLRESRKVLSAYDSAYLDENPRFIGIFARFFAALEEGGSLFLTIYKDNPLAEEAQRSFYWRTQQFVLTDFGSRFVATDKGFWSVRWTPESVLAHLEKAGVDRAKVTFFDLNEIAWLVEAKK